MDSVGCLSRADDPTWEVGTDEAHAVGLSSSDHHRYPSAQPGGVLGSRMEPCSCLESGGDCDAPRLVFMVRAVVDVVGIH